MSHEENCEVIAEIIIRMLNRGTLTRDAILAAETCSVQGCLGMVKTRGMCDAHSSIEYERERRDENRGLPIQRKGRFPVGLLGQIRESPRLT